MKEVHYQQHQKKMLESEQNSLKEQLANFELEEICTEEHASNNVESECATHTVSSLKKIWESCESKLLSDEIRDQNEILDIAVLELEQIKITLDKREMLLESERKILSHLQEENEKLKRRLSLKVRHAVRKEDLELSDDEEQEKSSSSLVSYLVIDNDRRSVIPVALHLLVEGQKYKPIQLNRKAVQEADASSAYVLGPKNSSMQSLAKYFSSANHIRRGI
ncbi:hypothetical protein KIN20_025897 [Parelaphostrongylus tenuis]|uniref:Uncharacterized protein n=1 Tax=Parelaphostrongylus tenuis TaxID=148309 RepID=A0AAD5N4Z5_PARTN|nr:hypothetical protein KIN20_019067 [Parelaphostrongylus tenuis]KAJ1365533.1 hypothetical protein KIN20_025896 [Parelaphostrongylus tenuis]KAJ1365534.1 hypothetical protein KIN20_025897 [Parelaphostrongylus tenuis]